MPQSPVLLSLPIADRPTSHAFYTEGLGLSAPGNRAEDGVPEPLQLVLNEGLTVMLIPTGGFGWVAEGRTVADNGTSECLIGLSVTSAAEVDELVERADRAGGEVVTAPGPRPWGYHGAFADPDGHVWTVTAAEVAEA